MTTIVEVDYANVDELVLRSGKIEHRHFLTPAFAELPFMRDLMIAWDNVAHNYITEPRRELARSRALLRRERGDYFIINGPSLDGVAAAVDYVHLTDRDVPALISKSALSTASVDPRDVPDDYIDIYWETSNENGVRQHTFATVKDRVRVDRSILIRNANMLGFEFLSDELSTEGYWRLTQFTSQWWDESSTYGGMNFLGWILNARVSVEPLWTANGEDFFRYSIIKQYRYRTIQNVYISGQDVYFPTSRVILLYDAEHNPNIDLDRLKEFFLVQAPINVVLDEIVALPLEFEENVPTLAGTHYISRFTARAE